MTTPRHTKHFTSSILLWARADQPRAASMAYWSGPHSRIISATPGLREYRQVHLAENNPGRWPHADGLETRIPDDRRIDGIAEVTHAHALAPIKGRAQTALAFKDEVNVFRRTLYYGGAPYTSRWYHVAPGQPTRSRAVLYLRRRPGVHAPALNKALYRQLVPALGRAAALTELRTQSFLPWSKKLWDTPNVAHDNPRDQRLHASIILGFPSDEEREAFFSQENTARLNPLLTPVASAIHAYDVESTKTYVRDGMVLPAPEE